MSICFYGFKYFYFKIEILLLCLQTTNKFRRGTQLKVCGPAREVLSSSSHWTIFENTEWVLGNSRSSLISSSTFCLELPQTNGDCETFWISELQKERETRRNVRKYRHCGGIGRENIYSSASVCFEYQSIRWASPLRNLSDWCQHLHFVTRISSPWENESKLAYHFFRWSFIKLVSLSRRGW